MPGLPDQAAFHEAFADIAALLSVLAIPDAVAAMLPAPDPHGRIDVEAVSANTLKASPLFGIAEELATPGVIEEPPETAGTYAARGALRRAVSYITEGAAWRRQAAFEEAYTRGDVLVAAVMSGLLAVWTGRIDSLDPDGRISSARAAEEGARAAADLLNMCVRALDYTPPVEFEFGDFLDAIVLADQIVSPDDPNQYQRVLCKTFENVGIRTPARQKVADATPIYHGLNFGAFGVSPDEVHRYIWHNAGMLELDLRHPVRVERVYRARRVGPQGLVVEEALADYTQHCAMSVAQLRETLRQHHETLPRQLPGDSEVQLWGGGTLVFNDFGRLRYLQTKPLDDWARQAERLRYLSKHGKLVKDTYGFDDNPLR